MRVATTMSMVLLSGVLFAGSASAECASTCEGECREEMAMCRQGAALEAKADKMACINEVNEGLLECYGGELDGRHECAELCREDVRACLLEVRGAFKECKDEVRSAFSECKAEASEFAKLFKEECREDKVHCLEECQDEPEGPGEPEPPVDGGGLS